MGSRHWDWVMGLGVGAFGEFSTDLEELTQSILSKPMPVEPEAVSRFASAPPTRAKFVKPAPDPLPTPHPIVEPDKGAQAVVPTQGQGLFIGRDSTNGLAIRDPQVSASFPIPIG